LELGNGVGENSEKRKIKKGLEHKEVKVKEKKRNLVGGRPLCR